MSGDASDIPTAIETLRRDPKLSELLDPDAVALAWSLPPERILWASPAAADLRAELSDDEGRARTELPAVARLFVVAQELDAAARFSGFERLADWPDLAGSRSGAICRLVDLPSGKALLTTVERSVGGETSGREARPTAGPGTVLRAEIDRIRREGTRRFIWSIGPDGRFSAVSNPFGEMLGQGADIVGLSWAEVAGGLALDEHGTVASHLEHRDTWSNETVYWRVPDTGYLVPVDLGGMPIYDRSHALEGFRGFGLVRGGDVFPEHDGDRSSEPAPSRPAPPGDETPAVRAIARESAYGAMQVRVGAQLGAVRPVPLRSVPDPASDQAPALSVTERGALKEIARALGARLEDEPPAEAARSSADVVRFDRPRGRDPDVAKVLDRLPVGIVIVRGEHPVFANRFLLDLVGHENLAGFIAEGGVSRLFAGRVGGSGRGNGSPSLTLLGRVGPNVPVEARLTTVEWADQPASAMLIRPLSHRDDATEAAPPANRTGPQADDLARMVDLSGSAFVTLDGGGRIVRVNRAAEGLFGLDEAGLVGSDLLAFIAPQSHRAILELIGSARVPQIGASEPEGFVDGRLAGGGTVRLLVRVGRIGAPEASGLCLAFQNMDALRSAETERDRILAGRRSTAAAQADLLHGLSGQLKEPLNTVTSFADIMLDERFGPLGSERYRAYLADVRTAAQQAIGHLDELVDVADVVAGRSGLRTASLDLNDVVAGVVARLEPEAASSRVVVRTRLAPGLVPVQADEAMITRMVGDLATTAIRSSEPGAQVILSTGMAERGDVVLRVRDAGPGLDAEALAAALEPFGPRHASSDPMRPTPSFALPKAIAEGNGARIAFRTSPGDGMLVEVFFRHPSAQP